MPVNAERALLGAIALELADLRTGIDDLAGLLSELTAYCPADLRAEAMKRNQAFDLVIQRLEGLGGLIAALGAGTPDEVALRALSLSDMFDRLSGASGLQAAPPIAAPPVAAPGDVMLFD